jgi:DNA-binding response OmpR family regulator
MGNSKVVVDIIAPNSRTFNMLEFVLQQHGKGRFELSRGNRPDLVVVDFDKSDVLITFRKFRSRFPDTPAVLLLNQSEEYEALPEEVRIGAEFILLKPFAAKDFISKINECLGGISESPVLIVSTAVRSISHGIEPVNSKVELEPSTRFAAKSEVTVPLQTSSGTRTVQPATRQRTWEALENENIAYSFALESDIDMADANAVASIWLKTDQKLLGYLKRAISQQTTAQTAICLSIGESSSFYISPNAKTVAVAGKNNSLFELAAQDFDDRKVSVIESAMPDRNVITQLETEAFLWKLALHTYRGYLPDGIDVNKPVYLKYWPNLTRLDPTPDAMRIASLLCRQPVALAFIVRILNIPQKHVFNFFSAANAIGYAGPAVREVDNMLLPSYPDELRDSLVRGSFDKPFSQNKSTR